MKCELYPPNWKEIALRELNAFRSAALKRRIAKALKEDPAMPQDLVIANLAASAIDVS